jgi:ketosteroid isomerase-like protein
MLRTIVLAAFLLMSACYVAAAQQTTANQYADLQKNFAEAYNRKDVDAMAAAFTDNAKAAATADGRQKQLDRFADLPDRGDRPRLSLLE